MHAAQLSAAQQIPAAPGAAAAGGAAAGAHSDYGTIGQQQQQHQEVKQQQHQQPLPLSAGVGGGEGEAAAVVHSSKFDGLSWAHPDYDTIGQQHQQQQQRQHLEKKQQHQQQQQHQWVLSLLSDLLMAHTSSLSSRIISNCLWSAAKLQLCLPQHMLHTLLHLFEAKVATASPQDLANTLWALAVMREGKQEQQAEQQLLVQQGEQGRKQQQEEDGKGTKQQLQLQGASKPHLLQQQQEGAGQVGKAQQSQFQQQEEESKPPQLQTQQEKREWGNQHQQEQHKGRKMLLSSSWLASFWLASERQLQQHSPQEIANTLYAAAALGLQPPPSWCDKCLEATAALWELQLQQQQQGQREQQQPGQPQQQNAAQQQQQHVGSFESLAGPGRTLDGSTNSSSSSSRGPRAKSKSSSFTPQTLTNITWSLAKLGIRPDSHWLRTFQHVSLHLLPRFKLTELLMVLEAVAELQQDGGRDGCWQLESQWLLAAGQALSVHLPTAGVRGVVAAAVVARKLLELSGSGSGPPPAAAPPAAAGTAAGTAAPAAAAAPPAAAGAAAGTVDASIAMWNFGSLGEVTLQQHQPREQQQQQQRVEQQLQQDEQQQLQQKQQQGEDQQQWAEQQGPKQQHVEAVEGDIHSWQHVFQYIEEVSLHMAVQQMEQWNVQDAVMVAQLPPGAAAARLREALGEYLKQQGMQRQQQQQQQGVGGQVEGAAAAMGLALPLWGETSPPPSGDGSVTAMRGLGALPQSPTWIEVAGVADATAAAAGGEARGEKARHERKSLHLLWLAARAGKALSPSILGAMCAAAVEEVAAAPPGLIAQSCWALAELLWLNSSSRSPRVSGSRKKSSSSSSRARSSSSRSLYGSVREYGQLLLEYAKQYAPDLTVAELAEAVAAGSKVMLRLNLQKQQPIFAAAPAATVAAAGGPVNSSGAPGLSLGLQVTVVSPDGVTGVPLAGEWLEVMWGAAYQQREIATARQLLLIMKGLAAVQGAAGFNPTGLHQQQQHRQRQQQQHLQGRSRQSESLLSKHKGTHQQQHQQQQRVKRASKAVAFGPQEKQQQLGYGATSHKLRNQRPGPPAAEGAVVGAASGRVPSRLLSTAAAAAGEAAAGGGGAVHGSHPQQQEQYRQKATAVFESAWQQLPSLDFATAAELVAAAASLGIPVKPQVKVDLVNLAMAAVQGELRQQQQPGMEQEGEQGFNDGVSTASGALVKVLVKLGRLGPFPAEVEGSVSQLWQQLGHELQREEPRPMLGSLLYLAK